MARKASQGIFGGCCLILLFAAACGSVHTTQYVLDFTDDAPGWFLPVEARLNAQVENGYLSLSLKPPGMVGWALSPFAFRDGQVEVEGTLLKGPFSTDYGLILHADRGRFYRFVISADGHYAVFFYDRSSWRNLVDWATHPAIRTGRTTNHLRVRSTGSEMIFWVNGVEIARLARDPNVESGRVGVSIGTMAGGNAQVAFDRFLAVRDR
ncbi:MAG: hypothetical protein RMK32_01720 [Anaerolineae bacterium]|nr:hypothetical protein [Anaerolineae bacterium]